MYDPGRCYEVGAGVEEGIGKALRGYRKAAEQGDCRAVIELGVRYTNGNGVEANRDIAWQWYRTAVTTLKWIHSQDISSFAKWCAENDHLDWVEWLTCMEKAGFPERPPVFALRRQGHDQES